ncbi:DUF4041 domain-containing protein [Microbacterium esteraromaticum]|uniref:DUF4041 domain-containing protein n=1 Tax=Microbacterium esteraromaticum TaxID=57043 RepID=UPI0023678917|nr:DUF4041 domain-containing protein [Microbacterium esteraromaticum]WDH77790.1 DUF4041 domain-containing protein [Microbacterium esteraromaticum]
MRYVERVTHATVQPGWHRDPSGKFEQRYWDGVVWTEHVFSNGVQSTAPLTPVPAEANQVSSSVVGSAVPPQGAVAAAPKDASPKHQTPAENALALETVPLVGARKHAEKLRTEVARLQGLINQYGLQEVAALEALKAHLAGEAAEARAQIGEASSELAARRTEIAAAQASLLDLRGAHEVQELGLYDYEHPAEDSVALATQLEALRTDIKTAVRAGRATQATSNFTFNNSSAKGAKFVRDMSKLMLRSYNAEAENCVKAVRAGNLATAQKRLTTAMEQIARLGTMIDLSITSYFHQLRLRELELANRHLRAVQAEKEADRAHREELREQRKAEKELAAEKVRLEKERGHYANTIATLEANGDHEGAERMRARLADVEHAIENVDYRAANIRAGYVYVISNIGSFGPDVVKIGLTRRLEPMDRVNELGDASVPFRFDVHALFFADDAVSIEAMLHQHFADRRINQINMRREYFRTTPTEVREVLKAHSVELLDFKLEPAAEEYLATRALQGI